MMNKPAISLNFNLPSYLKPVSYLSDLQEMIFNKEERKVQKSRSFSNSENSTNSSYDNRFLNQTKENTQTKPDQNETNFYKKIENSKKVDTFDKFDTFVNIENSNLTKTNIFNKIHDVKNKNTKFSKFRLFYKILLSNRKEIFNLIIFLFFLVLNIYNFIKILKINNELEDLKAKTNDLLLITKKLNETESLLSEHLPIPELQNTIAIGLTGV